MAEKLKLEIVTPEDIAYSELVDMVTLPAVVGELGIYPNHIRLMTQMVPGEITVHKDGGDSYLAVGEGLVEVTATGVAILTDMAVAAGNIDAAKAEETRQRAEAQLREKISADEAAAAHAALVRSLAQLQVKRRRRN